jgi:hypothetical protein
VRYTRLPHTPPRYQPLWCGTPGYLTPNPGTSRYGAVHQVTSHPTQVPAVMVRYTRLSHTSPRYQQLWCGTPGFLTPHLGTSRYSAVQQDILHSTQIPAVMGRYTMLPLTPPRYQQFSLTREMAGYTRLQNPSDFPEASCSCCTQCTVNTKLHNASVINPNTVHPAVLLACTHSLTSTVNCFKENLPHFPAGGKKKKKMMRS